MCDFRRIKSIRLKDTGELLLVDEVQHCTAVPGFPDSDVPHVSQVSEPGLYHIAASGSYHAFYNGERWLYEWDDDGFEVVDFENLFRVH